MFYEWDCFQGESQAEISWMPRRSIVVLSSLVSSAAVLDFALLSLSLPAEPRAAGTES